MKKLIISIILLLFVPTVYAKENYYTDNLNALSYETINTIEEKNKELGGRYKIYVLTVGNLDENPYSYGLKAFDTYQLGDNGILILLAKDKRGNYETKIVVGDNLKEIFTQDKINNIVKIYMSSYSETHLLPAGKVLIPISRENLDKGIVNGIDIISEEILKVEEKTENPVPILNTHIFIFLFMFAVVCSSLILIKAFQLSDNLTFDYISQCTGPPTNNKIDLEKIQEVTDRATLEELDKSLFTAKTYRKQIERSYNTKINRLEIKDIVSGEVKLTESIVRRSNKELRNKVRMLSNSKIKLYVMLDLDDSLIHEMLNEEYLTRKNKGTL